MNLTDEPFPQALSRLLAEQDMSQSSLGRASGVSQRAIWQYLQGASQPTRERFELIARAFGLRATYFPEYRLELIIETLQWRHGRTVDALRNARLLGLDV